MHTIQNSVLRISVSSKGAELNSLYHKPSATEHLWQADNKWWGWHAPNLFPVIGRCLNDEIVLDNTKYAIEKHGFARHSTFQCVVEKEDELHFLLTQNGTTTKSFPFNFNFKICYRIIDNTLVQTYQIENTGNSTMYFSVGAHPAFNVPFYANESFEDYTINFEKEEALERHHINAEGFFDERKSIVSLNGKINLHPTLFKDDALIFKNQQSKTLSIESRNHKQKLTVNFGDFPYLGIWTKEGAPFVCIEPWLGCADTARKPSSFKDKEGILTLEKGKIFSTKFNIAIS
jgi:galactose mutarotase-like enzyme